MNQLPPSLLVRNSVNKLSQYVIIDLRTPVASKVTNIGSVVSVDQSVESFGKTARMSRFDKSVKVVRYPRRAMVAVYGTGMNWLFGGNFGDPVIEEDWDNLIILDACRYDLFVKCNILDGDLHAFHSMGSHTGEFVKRNFAGGLFLDVVYVSANPNPATEYDAEFAAVEEAWDSGWDEDLHTVPPEEMVKQTIEAEQKYPNKRLISHFLQPHYPWIGPEGQVFMSEHGYTPQDRDDHIWLQLRDGRLERQHIWNLYRENLEETLPHVESLLDQLHGKTVVTSDHGNGFGEWGIYGHPARAYIDPLVKVPWLETPYEDRKEIQTGDTDRNMDQFNSDDVPKERLRDLGYV